jgi:hypothetical protein
MDETKILDGFAEGDNFLFSFVFVRRTAFSLGYNLCSRGATLVFTLESRISAWAITRIAPTKGRGN